MSDQLQVTFRHLESSESLRELAEQKFLKLKTMFPDITSCHVVFDCPELAHHHKGNSFQVQIEVAVARGHLHVSAEGQNEDAYAAAREAFEKVKRQIDSRFQRQQV